MAEKKNMPTESSTSQATTLRQKAEDVLQKQHPERGPVAPEDARLLLHDLEVHQIELEMQNEELRRAQLELDAERARYFDLYDLAPVGYFTLSDKGLIIEANLTVCSLLALDRKNFLMKPLSDFILAEDVNIFYLHRKKLLETGMHQIFRIRMLRQDGTLFWAQMEAIEAQDSTTGAPVIRVVMSDITVHKQEEEALEKSEARFRSYFDLHLHGIAITSVTKGWMQVNDKLCLMLGYSRDEIIRMTWTEMTHPDDLAADLEQFELVLSGKIEQYTMDKRFIRKDGSIVWTSLGVGCVRTSDGSVDYIIALLVDINDRKQAENAVKVKNVELERFTRAVSHDLKSPLVTIRTFLGHLIEDMAAGDKTKVAQDLAFVHSSAEKMNALLDDLLKLSQVGSIINPSVEASFQDIAQEALVLTAGRIDKRGVRVEVTEKLVMLYGDRMRLVEVFQNLIDNAVKFMGEQTEPLIQIGAETKHGESIFFVRDNGMGIDLRHKDRLFLLFERFNPEIKGTGLGLALVKRIVEMHGGRVWAESEGLGKGSCFWFSLQGKPVQGSKGPG